VSTFLDCEEMGSPAGPIVIGIVVLALFCMVAVIAGVMLTLESSFFVSGYTKSVAPGGAMEMYANTSLHPYSGDWDSSATAQTEAQCIATCVASSACRGFIRHNDFARSTTSGNCYFYNSNNVSDTVGSGVNVDPFFVQPQLVIGVELPGYSSDVFVKDGQAPVIFRSHYDKPVITA